MIVTDMPVERLIPYARNPRNNAAAIDAVKASFAEFGFRQPIVVDEKMVVIVGHTCPQALAKGGLRGGPAYAMPPFLDFGALALVHRPNFRDRQYIPGTLHTWNRTALRAPSRRDCS